MSGRPAPFAMYAGGAPAQPGGLPDDRRIQELWFAIARHPWASLVLVPADVGISTGPIAIALAAVGTRLRDTPVNAIVAETIDYASARSLSELQPRLRSGSWDGDAQELEVLRTTGAAEPGSPRKEAKLMPPLGRAIISILPVVSDPLGIAIAHAADAAVICIELGATRMTSARRTVEIIGADRVIGAFLLR